MTATIADVAARAGVSTATVSRVLAGVGRARPRRRRGSSTAARALDYRPSVARSLKRRSTQTLGLIITDIENPYFPQLVRSVEDAARRRATRSCCATPPTTRTARRPTSTCWWIGGSTASSSPPAAWAPARASGSPRRRSRSSSSTPPRRTSDCRRSCRTTTAAAAWLAEHLLDSGIAGSGTSCHRRATSTRPARLAGVRGAARRGLSAGRPAMARRRGAGRGRRGRADELLDRSPETTAFVAYNDLMAIGALRALRRRGGRVPADERRRVRRRRPGGVRGSAATTIAPADRRDGPLGGGATGRRRVASGRRPSSCRSTSRSAGRRGRHRA